MRMILASCLFLLGEAMHASAGHNTTFKSAYAAHDEALDTDSQSIFWQAAPSVYAEVDDRGQIIPDYRTRIRSRWTNKYLYILFTCPYEDSLFKAFSECNAGDLRAVEMGCS